MRTLLPVAVVLLFAADAPAQQPADGGRLPILDPQKLLDAQTFWDNRDWDWYRANIPFFECPDPDITTTYYYRWELVTKHLTYGSPNTGYVFTEFIDRPFWSGTYGAISCPAGLQLYEVRWLRDPRYARDYARYWFRTPGAQPRRYSTWLADSVLAVHHVHPDDKSTVDLLPDLVKNYEGWERERFDKDVGLFWQTGHDDGMEYNINSRQTKDPNRGAPGYRPTLNSYMIADAWAISSIASGSGNKAVATAYWEKAQSLSEAMGAKLWDPKRQFFFHMARQDETVDKFTVKALSLTHQTGRYAGDPHGRELIGYVPWQFQKTREFSILTPFGSEVAWKWLMDKDGFWTPFGPTTVERHDPLFKISPTCCWWSGNSWPYATSQTLKAMANLLQDDEKQDVVTKADYIKLLTTYAKTHRKNGKPYVAEACNPDTGSWEGHDTPGHSNHYFHSSFCDLVITGLMGFEGRSRIRPLFPPEWDYCALDGVRYRGRTVSILWDKTGKRYGKGAGFHVFVDGKLWLTAKTPGGTWKGHEPVLDPLGGLLQFEPIFPAAPPEPVRKLPLNYAVNNDANLYPRVSTSYTGPRSNPANLIDGNYWYHVEPPNRWTCEGSPNASDTVTLDFGTPRPIDTVKLYFLDDGTGIVPPAKVELEAWDGKQWAPVPGQRRDPSPQPPPPKGEGEKDKAPPSRLGKGDGGLGPIVGRRPTTIPFPELRTARLRAVLTHAANGKTGLTEFEAWGPGDLPVQPAPMPAGNLAHNPTGQGFPKASASHTSRFDKVEEAIDGKVNFTASPHNRWTSYESPNATDWLEIDFGEAKTVARVELAIYDDRGGVQAPSRYDVQFWDGSAWKDVANPKKSPEQPRGGQFNEVRFDTIKTAKVRVVFTHSGKSRSGVTEVLVWGE